MKKFVYLIVFVIFISVLYLVYTSFGRNTDISKVATEVTPTQSFQPSLSVSVTKSPEKTITSDEYKSSWILVRDIKKLNIIPNLEDKLTTKEAKDKYGCINITSAAFWKDTGEHIGLLVVDGKNISSSIDSDTFNGYFYTNNQNEAYIKDSEPPETSIVNAIQSGPILMFDGMTQKVSSTSGENARRMILATDTNHNITIITIYYKANPLLGPKLEELPNLLRNLKENTSLDFNAAINIDGGAHSSFISDELSLPEVSPVGSFLCILP